MTLATRLLPALISAAGMWPSGELGEVLDQTLPKPGDFFIGYSFVLGGLLYGALVLAPFAWQLPGRAWRVPLLVLGSVAIFQLAIEVAVGNGWLAAFDLELIGAGVVGAVLCAVALGLLARWRPRLRHLLLLVCAGALGGAGVELLFGVNGSGAWRDTVAEVASFALWQIPVALALAAPVAAPPDAVRGMGGRSWRSWIEEYEQAHRHPINRWCHTLGIPMIVIALVMFALCLLAPEAWRAAVVWFVLGWVLQFVGHAFERKPPEFFKDWRFLLVGLRWWWAKMTGYAGR